MGGNFFLIRVVNRHERFDRRYFAMEKLYCKANNRAVAKYFELNLALMAVLAMTLKEKTLKSCKYLLFSRSV